MIVFSCKKIIVYKTACCGHVHLAETGFWSTFNSSHHCLHQHQTLWCLFGFQYCHIINSFMWRFSWFYLHFRILCLLTPKLLNTCMQFSSSWALACFSSLVNLSQQMHSRMLLLTWVIKIVLHHVLYFYLFFFPWAPTLFCLMFFYFLPLKEQEWLSSVSNNNLLVAFCCCSC